MTLDVGSFTVDRMVIDQWSFIAWDARPIRINTHVRKGLFKRPHIRQALTKPMALCIGLWIFPIIHAHNLAFLVIAILNFSFPEATNKPNSMSPTSFATTSSLIRLLLLFAITAMMMANVFVQGFSCDRCGRDPCYCMVPAKASSTNYLPSIGVSNLDSQCPFCGTPDCQCFAPDTAASNHDDKEMTCKKQSTRTLVTTNKWGMPNLGQ